MSIELFSIQTLFCCIAYFFAGIVDFITGGGGIITLAAMLTDGIPVHYIIGTNQCAAKPQGAGGCALDSRSSRQE